MTDARTRMIQELINARAAYHDKYGVQISVEYARFLTAIGMIQDELTALSQAGAPAQTGGASIGQLKRIMETFRNEVGSNCSCENCLEHTLPCDECDDCMEILEEKIRVILCSSSGVAARAGVKGILKNEE